MIRVSINGSIDNALLVSIDVNQAEEIIQDKIIAGISGEIKNHFDEMGFIDIQPNESTASYDWKADFNICSTQEEQTVAQLIVQRLLDRKVSAEDIEYILEPLTSNNGGW